MFIGDLFNTIEIKPAKVEKAKDVIDKIYEEIKKEQKVKYVAVMSKLLAIKNNKDVLDWLHSECLDYRHRHGSYAKRFWGGFKEFSTDKDVA